MNETKYIKIKDCNYYSKPSGDSYYKITCPFCNLPVTAYAWSLAGDGKKCPNCKAKITNNIGTGEFKICKTN